MRTRRTTEEPGRSRDRHGGGRDVVANVWRALPGDLVGAGAALLAGARSRREVDVVRDDGTLLCRAVVVEDARLDRWLDRMPLRPGAMTFGRYVLARRVLSEATLRHELEHVRQWSRFGPLFLPAYLLESTLVRATGGHHYRDNVFELAARDREAPVSSGARPGTASRVPSAQRPRAG